MNTLIGLVADHLIAVVLITLVLFYPVNCAISAWKNRRLVNQWDQMTVNDWDEVVTGSRLACIHLSVIVRTKDGKRVEDESAIIGLLLSAGATIHRMEKQSIQVILDGGVCDNGSNTYIIVVVVWDEDEDGENAHCADYRLLTPDQSRILMGGIAKGEDPGLVHMRICLDCAHGLRIR